MRGSEPFIPDHLSPNAGLTFIIGSIGHFGWKCKIVILDQSQIIGAIILKYNGTIEPIYSPQH